jgi:membrane protease YdiL (CAAX protease family)
MAAHATARRILSGRPELLLLVATAALVAFHYTARADAVGVLRAGEWVPVTLAPLSPGRHFVWAGLLLGAGPVLLARVLCGLGPKALGLGLGRVRHGLIWLAVGVPLAVLAAGIGADSGAVRAVYPLDPALSADSSRMFPHALRQLLYFFAWEMLFRGVLLFGLRERVGGGMANAMQTALSVVAHFGRPLDETLAAIPAGLLFGWVDLRIGSVWYVAVIHWVVGAGLDWFIVRGG